MSLRWPGRLKQGDYPKANITNIYKYVYVQIYKGHSRQGDYSDSMRKQISDIFIRKHPKTFMRKYQNLCWNTEALFTGVFNRLDHS